MNPAAVQDELNFWKSFVKTDRFKNNWINDIINPELELQMGLFIKQNMGGSHGKVLDLGAGVVSILRNLVPDSQLVSCDPLANYYSEIFDYEANGIVKPLPYRTEDLPFKEEFDIVHMRNALDHSQDPLLAYKKMMKACKVGGHVIVSGFENEGTEEGWTGFHQWDLSVGDKTLYAKGVDGRRNPLAQDYTATIERRELSNEKCWFNWIVKKQ